MEEEKRTQDEKARAFGPEGAKQQMLENQNLLSKPLIIILGCVGLLSICISPVITIGIAIFLIWYIMSPVDKLRSEGKDNPTLYRVNFLEPALKQAFGEGVQYSRDKRLISPTIELCMPDIKKGDSYYAYSCHDTVEYPYRGATAWFSRASVSVPHGKDEYGDADDYRTAWRGEVYNIPYKTRVDGTVRIIPTVTTLGIENRGIYKGKTKQEVKVETDNIFFNEHYDVYATSQADAMYVLNPVVINYFSETAKHGVDIAMACGNKSFTVMIEGVRYNVFDVPHSMDEVQALSVEKSCREMAKVANEVNNLLEAINGQERE